mmetsp:Transcript_19776/g.50247  ORF Transcript_19776/g.50247 Transcript_19776/m.50247 type:complete len:207 (-) Transcript_19776:201-821(-)|eukprot:CAMPEP_0177655382 /NCGR_PEP_ID=MMETSP0447-20121125/14937_1 /TAXON_ID=0 /ORGANISM="Stygamoeba regulata, Strain BSH-02190019" /LENGTH=206 /DNA_ID=CAMNT_0019159297 /DNA_START=187 /DNA_END=807 /DNA_ORIENTATION=-
MGDGELVDYRFKLIMLGNIDVGKTSLIIRFTEGTFSEEILGEIDQKTRDLVIDGKTVRMIITDTAGQERFRTLTSSYYRNADAIIVVYDITDEESFVDVEGHISEGTRYSQRSEKFLVGNKLDLMDQRTTPYADGKATADKHGIMFFETSAKTGESVDFFFESIAKRLMGNAQARDGSPRNTGQAGIILSADPNKKKKPSKCILSS